MGFLKDIFGKKEEPIRSYEDFWNWFQQNEKNFFNVINQSMKGDRTRIEKDFFNKLAPKLNQIKDGFLYLAGMIDDRTAELVLTADGNIRNIVYVEELVQSAPIINGWKFTALKPAMDIDNLSISMGNYTFNGNNLSFYANELSEYPDEIDITIVHNDLVEQNKQAIINGTYIFLDNYLGELDFAVGIDNLTIIGKRDAKKELIPIRKLKDYLSWRQKEFVEKYEGIRYNTENDTYNGLEGETDEGFPIIAIINDVLINWDSKASHPWILNVCIKYNGKANNGMPGQTTLEQMNEFEDFLCERIKDFEGYLNIGRQTGLNKREIYFACKDFRKPSKILNEAQKLHSDKLQISFEIYKDKYWQSLERFRN